MTIQADEAANALKEATAAAGRAQAARGYQLASGYLIVWGVVWVVANVASQFSQAAGIAAWNLGALLGVAGSVALSIRQKRAGESGRVWKSVLVALAIGGFGFSAAAI